MLVSGIVKRVQDRKNTSGGIMRTYDIMDESAGRVQVTHYPEDGEVGATIGQVVKASIGQVRAWSGKSGAPGVSLIADSIS